MTRTMLREGHQWCWLDVLVYALPEPTALAPRQIMWAVHVGMRALLSLWQVTDFKLRIEVGTQSGTPA